jgi:hypothetical protein
MLSHNSAADHRSEGKIIGGAAIVLALGGLLAVVTKAPWEIRFPLITAGSLFGPAIPALRLFSGFTLLECIVYGIGVDVGLLMLISLGLVLAHSWFPAVAVVILLLTSLAAGARLMVISAGK